METWEKIVKANNEMKQIELKGKQYTPVNERLLAFRKVYPNGQIFTEPTFTDNYIMVKATISITSIPSDIVLATGYARELANRPFALENAETSAIGRAISIATGLGVQTSLASAEDMEKVDSPSGMFEGYEEQQKHKKEVLDKFNKLLPSQQAQILNVMKKKEAKDIDTDLLEELVRNAK